MSTVVVIAVYEDDIDTDVFDARRVDGWGRLAKINEDNPVTD